MPRGSSGPSLFRIDDGSASGYRDIGVAIVSLGTRHITWFEATS